MEYITIDCSTVFSETQMIEYITTYIYIYAYVFCSTEVLCCHLWLSDYFLLENLILYRFGSDEKIIAQSNA